ncbi:MAG: hypothetical protein HYX69_21430 [Planctomycetia bacterium]|nr:hypothetical protein [Planctomycetia bacterium]
MDPAYYQQGDLAGSLKSEAPLPLYDGDPQSLVNRLFAAFYIRASNIPPKRGGMPVPRIEGGDVIDFLAWSGSDYWTAPETCQRLSALLDECLADPARVRPADPLRRAMLQRDLWAPFDFFVSGNIARLGDKATRQRRDSICRKLAAVIRTLTLTQSEIAALPDTYALAVESGRFAADNSFDPSIDYLPKSLLTDPNEWQEIDFFQPKDIHEDIQERFVTLHTRNYKGRSYFRVFYRFPGGRPALDEYFTYVDAEGIDWKRDAHRGFISIRGQIRQIPVGTEVALVQFLITLDDRLRPMPTPIVESVRLRAFRNVDGQSEPPTNTGVGMNVSEFTLKRRLLFDGLKQGGLVREPDDQPIYRVIFQPENAPDWGDIGRSLTLVQDCRRCHTGAGQIGVQTIFSFVHQGGVDAGAQLGVAHALPAAAPSPHGARAATWKSRHETYRRLLDYLGE